MADGLTIPRDDSVALMKTGGRARSLSVNAHDHSTPSVASLDRDWLQADPKVSARDAAMALELRRDTFDGS